MATWRFNPKTGATYIIDDELHQPDGIGFSPDGKILYIGDSGESLIRRCPRGVASETMS